MFPRLALLCLSLFGLLSLSSPADAGLLDVATRCQSAVVCNQGGQVGYIWSVELYSQCPVHGSTLYGRYLVTCDFYGNYLDYGGIEYASADIRASGREPVVANHVFVRTTNSW